MNNIFYNFVTWVFIFFILCLGAAIVSGLWFFLKVYLANLVKSGLRRDYIRESFVDNKDEEEERQGGRCCLMSKECCPYCCCSSPPSESTYKSFTNQYPILPPEEVFDFSALLRMRSNRRASSLPNMKLGHRHRRSGHGFMSCIYSNQNQETSSDPVVVGSSNYFWDNEWNPTSGSVFSHDEQMPLINSNKIDEGSSLLLSTSSKTDSPSAFGGPSKTLSLPNIKLLSGLEELHSSSVTRGRSATVTTTKTTSSADYHWDYDWNDEVYSTEDNLSKELSIDMDMDLDFSSLNLQWSY